MNGQKLRKDERERCLEELNDEALALHSGGHTKGIGEGIHKTFQHMCHLSCWGAVAEKDDLVMELAKSCSLFCLLEWHLGDACLEACTKEKACFQAGEEFGKLEGHLLIAVKALCGLCSSGA